MLAVVFAATAIGLSALLGSLAVLALIDSTSFGTLLIPAWLLVDLSMIGYLGGPRLGSITYNAAHNLVLPIVLLGLGWWTDTGWLLLAGAVFVTHIGLDRALGYGLKLPTDFRDTHLGRIGRG